MEGKTLHTDLMPNKEVNSEHIVHQHSIHHTFCDGEGGADHSRSTPSAHMASDLQIALFNQDTGTVSEGPDQTTEREGGSEDVLSDGGCTALSPWSQHTTQVLVYTTDCDYQC